MVKRNFIIFMVSLIFIMSTFMIGCDDAKGDDAKGDDIPKYLFNSNGKYICHVYSGYLYNKQNNRGIAYYDAERGIFISLNGRYFGEVIDGDLIMYNINSKYQNSEFETKPLPPIAPTQPTPPTHKTPKTQPSNWRDVIL